MTIPPCPECHSTDVEEVGEPLCGNAEFECQTCGYHYWSDEVEADDGR